MLIQGPLKITIGDPADGQGRVLVVGFPAEFRALEPAGRAAELSAYLASLHREVANLADPTNPNSAGMLIVAQFVEELLPHIAEDEIELSETIILHIRQESQAVALTELLRGM